LLVVVLEAKKTFRQVLVEVVVLVVIENLLLKRLVLAQHIP
jgi:hypothetical protein